MAAPLHRTNFLAPFSRSLLPALCLLSLGVACGSDTQDPSADSSDAGSTGDASSISGTDNGDTDQVGSTAGSGGSNSDNTASSDQTSSQDKSVSDSGGETSDSTNTTDSGASDSNSESTSSNDTSDSTDTVDPVDCETVEIEEHPCNASDIDGKLACVPGLKVLNAYTNLAGQAQYSLELTQEVEHGKSGTDTFSQRLSLAHVDETLPLVLKTSGYTLSGTSHELASLFDANVISYEHRFFASSVPSGGIPWEHLTIQEAAADAHEIWRGLKWIYRGPWVSSGASKGGETSVFHRRFHPCDLEATVAYVAPLVLGTDDQRFPDFLDQVGGSSQASCRQALRKAQNAMLDHRDELVAMMNSSDFTQLAPEVAFEHAVMELYFAFWQYSSPSQCGSVPGANASVSELYDYLESVGQLSGFATSGLEPYQPYFYASAVELGAPGADLADYEAKLKHLDTYKPESYLPKGLSVSFSDDAMPDVQAWVKSEGERIIFIYGEYDPWTAAAYDISGAKDTYLYTVAQGNHGSSISALDSTDREEAIGHLEDWLGVQAKRRKLPLDAPELVPERRPRL